MRNSCSEVCSFALSPSSSLNASPSTSDVEPEADAKLEAMWFLTDSLKVSYIYRAYVRQSPTRLSKTGECVRGDSIHCIFGNLLTTRKGRLIPLYDFGRQTVRAGRGHPQRWLDIHILLIELLSLRPRLIRLTI